MVEYVLYSILSVDGINILPIRADPEKFYEMKRKIQKWDKAFVNQIIDTQAKLQRWYEFEMFNVARFAYEDESDGLWEALKTAQLNTIEVTGLPGTQYTGFSWHQIEWKYQSSQIERFHDMTREMRVARYIVSPHIPKKDLEKHDAKILEYHRNRIDDIIKLLEGNIEVRDQAIKDLVGELHRQTDDGWEERLEWDEKVVLEQEENAAKQAIWNIFGSRMYQVLRAKRLGKTDYSLLNYDKAHIDYNRDLWKEEIVKYIEKINKSRIRSFDLTKIDLDDLLSRMEQVVNKRLDQEEKDSTHEGQ